MRQDDAKAAVLVTGTTGFIGRAVVRRLLSSHRRVVALARQGQGQSAAERVATAVGVLPDGQELRVVESDFTLPDSGLPPTERLNLQNTIETVMHCAGETLFFPDDMARYRIGHVNGPLRLLEMLRGGRLRSWCHLSTAYVCGRRSGMVYEHEGDIGQEFHNPYERVKLESETAMRHAGKQLNVDIRVFRPSAVVGPAPETVGGHPSNLFFAFIRLAVALAQIPQNRHARLRIEAAPKARFNIVPLDYVAGAMVTLAEHPDAAGGTFHLVASAPPRQEVMAAMIAACLGLRGLSVVDACRAPLTDPSPLERKVARMLAVYREYLAQDVHFDDEHARALLARLGYPSATLGAVDVYRLIDQALTTTLPCATTHPLSLEAGGRRYFIPSPRGKGVG